METSESKLNPETKGKVVQIFPHFMARVAKFEELAAAGNRFLVNFRQGLEFIRRPPIDKTSEIFEKVIKDNNTDRIQSYIKAGYVHTSSRAENLNKCTQLLNVSTLLNASYVQLLNVTSKGNILTKKSCGFEINSTDIFIIGSNEKDIMNELECLVEDVKRATEAASETSQDYHTDLDLEGSVSLAPEKPGDVDYATMVAVVYSMVKQDYVMQKKIVSSLSLKTSSGELESYCLMWSLHPFVNDEIMHKAWNLIS
ncbi:uncharacterized protein LOC143618362 [Bidens hawaiensis]|uniref:uncharacterized protein LOC143618362 n=1 Tax=Bidens hawaiensis TaxID=980011 RepID=UPI00404AA8EE